MDDETISALKIVCTAGCACEGFDGDANERLKQLADGGLLVVARVPGKLVNRRTYKPTTSGWRLFRQLVSEGNTRSRL
jgi:hypothetical protein